MYYAAAAATAAAAAAAEAAYTTVEFVSATAGSAGRELQRLSGFRTMQNNEATPLSACWDEDKGDGWIVIMTPKLQRDADRQRSLIRAVSLSPDQRFICPICLDLLPFDDVFTSDACVPSCGKICRDCAKDHVLSKLGDQSFPVSCPAGSCVLSQQDVGGLLDEASMLRYLMLERYDYVRKNPRCVVCPSPSLDGNGCPGIVEMDEDAVIFVCPVCNHRRCVRCDVEAGLIRPYFYSFANSHFSQLILKMRRYRHTASVQL
jgi:hypothetical protein